MQRVGAVATHLTSSPAAAATPGMSFTVTDDTWCENAPCCGPSSPPPPSDHVPEFRRDGSAVKILKNTDTGEFAEIQL